MQVRVDSSHAFQINTPVAPLASASMASSGYYAFPLSSPYSSVESNAPPDRVPTPTSALSDKLQAYPPGDTLTPHRPPSPSPFQRTLRGLMDGHIFVLNLRDRLGGPPRCRQLPSALIALRQFRGPSRHFCSGKRRHKQQLLNICTVDSLLRSLGYSSPITFPLLRDSRIAQVFVEGHAIPPNAIIDGVDRRGPWHIARSFYEVRFPRFFHRYPSSTSSIIGFDG
jgi:hypothetical protein